MDNPRWTGVRFPGTALDAGKGVDPDTARGDEGVTWVAAPGTSHVHSFALIRGSDSRLAVVTGPSTILVRFKARGGSAPVSKYRYLFSSRAAAEAVFGELTSADHPGAHPMIQNPGKGIPGLTGYTRS